MTEQTVADARRDRAREQGRARGDETCRVPGADPDRAREALADELRSADDSVTDVAVTLAYAIARRDRLRERLQTGDVAPRTTGRGTPIEVDGRLWYPDECRCRDGGETACPVPVVHFAPALPAGDGSPR